MRLIAVGAVEANLVGELTENGDIAGDIVLRGRIVDTGRILDIDRGIVHAREYLVQVRVVEQLFDLVAVDAEVALGVVAAARSLFTVIFSPSDNSSDDTTDDGSGNNEKDEDNNGPLPFLGAALLLLEPI